MGTTDRRMALRFDAIDELAAELEAQRMTRRPITQARAQAIADRALSKSLEQVHLNNLPRQVRLSPREEVWSVHSRTGGDVYLVTITTATGEIMCSCPASIQCWHTVHCLRARNGEIGFWPLPRPTG